MGRISLLMLFGGAVVMLMVFSQQRGSVAYTDAPEIVVTYPPQTLPLTTSVWGVFDPDTGEIIAGNNTHEPRPIASITKLFTAHAAIKSNDVDEAVLVKWQDVATEGRAGKLSAGDETTRRELLFPLLIESSNDAGEALKRSLGTSYDTSIESVIKDVSLTETHIGDASGLGTNNTSSVQDLARFVSYVKKEEPYLLDITKLKMYIGEENGWVNNSPVREIEGFRGGKHGFTPEAGRTFVGTFYLKNIDREVGIALLGSQDLKKDVAAILSEIEKSEL